MAPENPYACLFEPVTIGPVKAKNRFYQVPHCTGLGHANPKAEVALRAMKAEGGWGVVCSQEVEIHPSSELTPYLEGRLWDDHDIPMHRAMTDAVHEHGALAGIELVHNGQHAANLATRVAPMGPAHRPVDLYHPVQARAMNLSDIKSFKQWHVDAALRAKRAGYDIVYVYAGHNMATLMHFLLPRYNDRLDAYGGVLENRARLLKETLCEVKDAVGDTCAIALRMAVDELMGDVGLQAQEEGAQLVHLLADIPDLWDVNVSGWDNDSATARFEPNEGYQEKYTAFVKSIVKQPVVGVGRFTSPNAMVSQINRGILDFIGAARPSIADPFLPNKIMNNELDTIRECIGCNICVSSDNVVAPIRCTQNPTMGEEWKRGWHPEVSALSKRKNETALVVGGGPSGLECALQLIRRGYQVMLAESSKELGGRLLQESKLPGLSSYIRVRDYRRQQLLASTQCELLLDNHLSIEDVLDASIQNVFIATGSSWNANGKGRHNPMGVNISDDAIACYTPNDLFNAKKLSGHVVVYDDDHYYMGGVIAELLQAQGCTVSLVTPAGMVSTWTEHTLEQHKIQRKIIQAGIELYTSQGVAQVNAEGVVLECVYSGREVLLTANALVMVTSREPNTALFEGLVKEGALEHVLAVGDCLAPSTVAAAVYSGHLAARSLHADEHKKLFIREAPPN